MSYSTQRTVSDGTLQLLSLSINFFDKSEISVYLNNVPTTAYTWATANSIHMNSAVPLGVELLVRRTTDLSEVRHVFSLGAQFKDSTLDDDFRQILHIAQEAVEGANVGDIYAPLNMHGNTISNVGPAAADGDAISLGQVRTESQGAFLANSQAQAAAGAAAASQGAAATSAGTATAQAGIATTAAGAATTQVGLATTQAGNAATSASLADGYKTAAANSATLAQAWANTAEDVVVAGGLYSAFHYMKKSQAAQTASSGSAAAAAASAASINLPAISGKALQLLRANAAETGQEYTPVINAIRPALLGTVSQSGGVPTGAVIESGSNANGSYVKYASGDMVCQFNMGVGLDQSNTTTAFSMVVTLPAAFTGNYTVIPNIIGVNVGNVYRGYSRAVRINDTTFNLVQYWDLVQTYQYSYIAIGRWF
jgi:hypothetical protein